MTDLKKQLEDARQTLQQAKDAANQGVYFELNDLHLSLMDICNQILQLPKQDAESFLPQIAVLITESEATAESVRQAGALQQKVD